MRFWYEWYNVAPTATAGGSTDLFLPEIEIRVIGKTGDAFLLGLLDTGADAVVLPRSVADAVGAELDEHVTWDIAGFAGQTASAVLGRVRIEVSDGIDTVLWPALVSVVDYPDPAEQPVLLGRTGFLQFFNAEFRGADHEVILEPNGTFP